MLPQTSFQGRASAIILAAGRGERMRPLSENCPKPLLKVQGKPLMQWSLECLLLGEQTKVLVNTAWLGERISEYFGRCFVLHPRSASNLRATQLAMSIAYSHEGLDFGLALETAGGIARALPSMASRFWVVAGDIFAPNFKFGPAAIERFNATGKLAHLWLVPNPSHNPKGDFGLVAEAFGESENVHLALSQADTKYTYSTIGLFRRELFAPPYCDIPFGNPHGVRAKLAPILRAAMDDAQVTAELYTGEWTDVGTPERLAELNANWSPDE